MSRGNVVAAAVLSAALAGCGPSRPEPEAPVEQVEEPVAPPPVEPVAVGFLGTQPGEIALDRWQTPESCSECHDQIHGEWSGAMHSNAGRDPLFLGVVQRLRDHVTSETERAELRTCIRCHSVAGHLSAGVTDAFADLAPLADLYDRNGVFCGFCHTVTGSRPMDGAYEVEPGPNRDDLGVIRGPRADARDDGHQVALSELHQRAAFCGTCHDQVHVASRVRIGATYTEWLDGPYNTGDASTTVVCQDCHMRQLPGVPATGSTPRPDRPGRSAPPLESISPSRPHIWVHNFVGANTLVPPMLADDDHAPMAVERLQHAATLELGLPERATPGSTVTIAVRVTNSGAGHFLPTGVTDTRQVWLELQVTAPRAGVTVFESGLVDDRGAIDPDAHTFGTTYGDRAGAPVLTSARAEQVLGDHRVPPRGTLVETYELTVPRGGGTLEVRARLRYRSASQEMVSGLLGAEAPEVPVTDMASAEGTIEVAHGD